MFFSPIINTQTTQEYIRIVFVFVFFDAVCPLTIKIYRQSSDFSFQAKRFPCQELVTRQLNWDSGIIYPRLDVYNQRAVINPPFSYPIYRSSKAIEGRIKLCFYCCKRQAVFLSENFPPCQI